VIGRRSREFFTRGVPTRSPSQGAVIAAIVTKDLRLFARDRLWRILTPLTLFAMIAVYFLLPARGEPPLAIGVAPASTAAALRLALLVGGEGAEVIAFTDEASLAAAVAQPDSAAGRPAVGLFVSAEALLRARAGERVEARVYVAGDVPTSVRSALVTFVREAVAVASGRPLGVDWVVAVVGDDRAASIPPRERAKPLLGFMLLLTESLALASLVSVEIARKTAPALLVSPARIGDVLIAKGIVGTLLAFVQATLLLLAIGAFAVGAASLLLALLLGAMLVTAVGMIAGAAGRDFLGTLFFGMAFLLVLLVPAVAALLPGSAASWVQVLPSHGVVTALVGGAVSGLTIGELLLPLVSAAAWVAVAFALAAWVLGRKLARS
jgi:ABC-2 type transport system permease protein